MIERVIAAFMALLLVPPAQVAAATWQERPDWAQFFQRDQDLRSSMRNSTVRVYQQFARELGEERERDYLRRITMAMQILRAASISSGSAATCASRPRNR